jgi:predicted amidohydrolase
VLIDRRGALVGKYRKVHVPLGEIEGRAYARQRLSGFQKPISESSA